MKISNLLTETGIFSFCQNESYAEIARRIVEAHQSLDGFAEACYDQNSVDDLVSGLAHDADYTDMKTWNISENEYFEAIQQALLAKAYDEDVHEVLTDA